LIFANLSAVADKASSTKRQRLKEEENGRSIASATRYSHSELFDTLKKERKRTMMKIKTMVLATVLVLGSVITGLAVVLPGSANAASMGNDNRDAIRTVGTIQLQCDNGGGQQDVAKTPFVTNTTGKTLPKGKKLFWHSTDGDKGVIQLEKALKPGETAIGHGHPGQNYQCTATTSAF
jgi:hypothetical protein